MSLEKERKKGKTYYRYRRPDDRRSVGLGTDLANAAMTAKKWDAYFELYDGSLPIDLKDGPGTTFEKWSKTYIEAIDVADKTRYEYRKMLELMAGKFGKIDLREIRRHHIASAVEGLPSTRRNRVLSVVGSCIQKAMYRGLCDINPTDGVEREKEVVARRRLTMDEYEAIHAKAPQWLQVAMDISHFTLLRRGDICALTRDCINGKHVAVTPRKTARKTGTTLMIEIGEKLRLVLADSSRIGVLSKYYVHLPDNSAGVSPAKVSRSFQAARDATGLFTDVPAAERPTFHEIRSLGAVRYEKSGVDPQTLLGHSGRRMTERYLDGHVKQARSM